MVGSKDLQPSTIPFFPNVFYNNQFRAKPQWPAPKTSLSGQTGIINGSNTGLGYEAARQLLGLELSHLILAVRSLEKGEAAAAKLRQLYPKVSLEVWQLDMSSYDSIKAFALRVDSQLTRIDIVILNAGVIGLNFNIVKSTCQEECVQVNSLSTVLLTILLVPILEARDPPSGQPAHLKIVSAALTLAVKFPNRDANPLLPSFADPKTFDRQEIYNSSKLLAHMFLWDLSTTSRLMTLSSTSPTSPGKGHRPNTRHQGRSESRRQTLWCLIGRTPFVDAVVNKGKESHGCFLMSWQIHPFAAFLYTPEGKVVTHRLWEETLAELDFTGVRPILDSMKA